MGPRDVFSLAKQAVWEWYEDNTFQMGAALAYYTIFSLAPLVVITVAVAGSMYGKEAARGQLNDQLTAAVGAKTADAIQALAQHTDQTASGPWTASLSLAVLLITASAVFGQLQQSLNTVWGVQADSSGSWLSTIQKRLWPFVIVLGVGCLLLASLAISTGLSVVSGWAGKAGVPESLLAWQLGDWLLSFALLTLLFAMIFKLLPDVSMAWRDVWIGAFVTAVLFTIGKFLIGLYLARASWISAYGAAGSLIVILVFVYYASQIFLLGAEFTQVYAKRYGKPVVKRNRARPIKSARGKFAQAGPTKAQEEGSRLKD
jgi:membrane protein